MAVKTSIAQGHRDMLDHIRRFATGHGMRGTPTYVGTGNGTITEVSVANATVVEVWTILCVDVTTVGAEVWTVTGSVTGLLAKNAITGVKYDEGIVEFLITAGGTNFILLDTFTVKDNVYTGTGNGTIGSVEQGKDTIDEVWTITVTNAAVVGAEIWSVVGSITGALANATTGVAYVTDHINFTITAGGTNFIVTDNFVFTTWKSEMSTLNRAWVQEKWNGNALYLKGVGTDGTKEIFIGIRAYEDVGADYYNFAIMGCTGHVDSNAFANQPGTSGERYVPFWNGTLPYKLWVNGQRIIIHALVESTYLSFYLGFITNYAGTNQMPYPLIVGGTPLAATDRYSVVTTTFFKKNSLPRFRDISGAWITLTTWPEGSYVGVSSDSSDRDRDTMQRRQTRDLGGEYPIVPVVLLQHITAWSSSTPDESGQIFGEYDGVVFITGFNMAVENVITDNATGKEYFVTRASANAGLLAYAGIEEA